MKIVHIRAREIFDSRGWPTVQCEVILENGRSVIASVPSGKSVGHHEAVELRDGGTRLYGRGVQRAVENIEQIIAPALIGYEPNALEIDLKLLELDTTPDKSRLGANATLAVSMAVYRAEAFVEGIELYELIALLMDEDTVTIPYPLFNLINGGKHASNNLEFQEFSIMPVGAPTFKAAMEAGIVVYRELFDLLKEKKHAVYIGREEGFSNHFKDEYQALDFLVEAIERANAKQSLSCLIGIDAAASEFYDTQTQLYSWHGKKYMSEEMIAIYEDMVKKYPIYILEDGLSQDDWNGWTTLTKALSNKVQIVGDDIFATNPLRIATGIEKQAANSVIIKPNQIGTVTEALQAIHLCQHYGLNTIVSHRSGETEDSFIADLAVGASAGQIKAGSCASGDGVAKYNRLLAIEDTLTLSLLEA